MDTFEKVRSTVSHLLEIGEDGIYSETSFDEIGADSIDLVDLAVELEEEFSISIPDEEFENIKTVGDLVELIDSLV